MKITETGFGSDDPRLAACLNNLASLLDSTGKLIQAESFYRRALSIDENHYGSDHPSVAIRLNNLAELLKDTGRMIEAEPLYRRAILILLRSSKASGHLLPNAPPGLRNYASALRKAGLTPEKIGSTIASLMAKSGYDPDELWPQIFGDA